MTSSGWCKLQNFERNFPSSLPLHLRFNLPLALRLQCSLSLIQLRTHRFQPPSSCWMTFRKVSLFLWFIHFQFRNLRVVTNFIERWPAGVTIDPICCRIFTLRTCETRKLRNLTVRLFMNAAHVRLSDANFVRHNHAATLKRSRKSGEKRKHGKISTIPRLIAASTDKLSSKNQRPNASTQNQAQTSWRLRSSSRENEFLISKIQQKKLTLRNLEENAFCERSLRYRLPDIHLRRGVLRRLCCHPVDYLVNLQRKVNTPT